MAKKLPGNPYLAVRIPRRLLRRFEIVAKEVYEAPVPVFTRDIVAAMVDADKFLQPFMARFVAGLARAETRRKQMELDLAGRKSAKGRPTGGEP